MWQAVLTSGVTLRVVQMGIAFLAGVILMNAIDKARIRKIEAAHANALLAVERARADAEEAARRTERMWAESMRKAEEELSDAKRRIEEQARAIARLDVDTRRLRDQLRAYAAGPAAGDTVAACQDRAGALADLLAEGAELLVEGQGLVAACAVAHDGRAAEVKALIDAWPSADLGK